MDTSYAWLVTIGVVLNIIAGVYYAFWMIANWKIFEKAGEKGWKALIPIYNLYVQYGLTWKSYVALPVIALLVAGSLLMQNTTGALNIIGSFASLAGMIIYIIGQNKLSKAFGRGKGFTVGLILLQPIFIMILGFGSDKFQGATRSLNP